MKMDRPDASKRTIKLAEIRFDGMNKELKKKSSFMLKLENE